MLNELKHVETHEHINWWLVNAGDWATAELVCFCSVSSLSLLLVSSSFDCFSPEVDHTALAQGLTKAQVHIHPTSHAHVSSCYECCSWSLRHLHSLLLLPYHLSDHAAVFTTRNLQLPWCRGKIPCVLPLRTLAPWPRTSLPHSVVQTVHDNTVQQIISTTRPKASGRSCGIKKLIPDNRSSCDVQNDWAEMPQVGIKMWTATIVFTKAFDFITHKSIWKALNSCGIEHDYISLLMKIYKDQKASVQTDVDSNMFEMKKGTKQGDPLSSLLPNMVLQKAWKTTSRAGKRKKEW